MMLNCHTKINSKDKIFLEKLCVKGLSNLFVLNILGLQGSPLHLCRSGTPPISQKVTKSQPIIDPHIKFLHSPHESLTPPYC